MKDQFVTYEIAKHLKELGFDEECFGFYQKTWRGKTMPDIIQPQDLSDEETLLTPYPYFNSHDWLRTSKVDCAAPLWQQAIDWLREKHKMHIYCHPVFLDNTFNGCNLTDGQLLKSTKHESFNDAREAAITKALELIK